jgi:hypothetical protein
MARPRELIEDKKSEQFTIRLESDDALDMYREAARRELKPAVLLRKAVKLGMAALLAASAPNDYLSCSADETRGDSE